MPHYEVRAVRFIGQDYAEVVDWDGHWDVIGLYRRDSDGLATWVKDFDTLDELTAWVQEHPIENED